MKHAIIPIAEIPVENSRTVDFFGRQVHVVIGPGDVPAAYMDACTHLGGPLACVDGKLQCAWHEASFDLKSGKRLTGPAPEGANLMRIPTRIEDGVLTYVWGE